MGKIINTKSITNSSETNAPKFNFSEYSVGQVYHNNEHEIDFVTDNKSLYVCLVDTLQTSKEDIEEQEGLLKIISQGEQGIQGQAGTNGAAGITPRIDAHFDGKQLIFSVDGKIKAVSPDLGGPSWRPVVNGTTLTWELSMDRYAPESIDLKQLRPISEHPIILRTNSDNTKYDWETSGPANYIQWKYEGDEYWNNLISISELMNLAVAGVCFWYNEETEEWHFGHKEIVKATYTADKNGRQIISNVELGDVLFDAGAVPMPDYSMEIDTIEQTIDEIKASLAGYATEEWVEGKGYLTGVDLDDYAKKSEIPSLVDAYTKAESDEKYQLKGNYLTAHQPIKNLSGQSIVGTGEIPLKTINGESIIGTGNITVSVGDANLFDLTTRTVNGVRHLIKTVNGVETDLGEFTNGSSSGTGSFDVKIDNNYLYKSTDNGTTWTQVGQVNSESGPGCAKCWSEEEITALFANNTIADLRIVNNVLQKKVNGSWSDVGSVGSDTGTGCEECFTTEQINTMISNALNGLLDDIVREADLDAYVKTSELTSNYYNKAQINAMLDELIIGGGTDYFRLFTLYQRTNSRTVAPTLPIVGNFTWSSETGELTLDPTFTSNWENHPQNATTEKPYLWMTSATYSHNTKSEVQNGEENGQPIYWSAPICLTGEPGSNGTAGDDGADGSGVEFIYTLIPDESYISFVSTPVAPAGQGDDDIPSGWTDHPQGIGEYAPKDIETTVSIPDQLTPMMWKVEMASIRIYDGASKTWGEYSKPFIWSMWGEDGIDGDGVEYIFCVTTQPSIATFITEIPINDEQVEALGAAYQVSDWTPYNGNWTDNPLDVDENQPYEWVAIRKYNGETGKWGPFSDPKVWGLWGQKTVYQAAESYYRPYMCYAFTRTNINDFANQYTVVSPWEYEGVTYAQWIAEDSDRESDFYDNPLNYIVTLVRDAGGSYVDDDGRWSIDTNIEWHDSIPSGTQQLYLINNLIGDEKDEETSWNGPTKWGDQAGFQTEYAASTPETDAVFAGNPVLPSLNRFVDDSPETVDEAAWRTVARTTGCGEWRDDNQISDPVYMATAYKKANGVWSDWTVAKIKGEKGNDGTDGTDGADGAGVEFVYFRTADESQVPAVSDTYGTYDKQTKVSEDPEIDDFLPLVVASGFTPTDDTLTINGEYFWHDNPEGVSETFQCEWVAVRFSAVSDSGKRVWGPFSVALWSKYGVNGKDGDGIEYVFHTSVNETKPTLNNNQGKCPKRDGTGTYEISTDYANRREWLPYAASGTPSSINDDFWTDDPSGVSPSAPYEWVAVRKYNGELKEWEQFGPVALWAKFAFDGRDSDEREFVYLIADSKPSIFGKVENGVLVDASGQSSSTVNDLANFNTPDYYPYAVVNGTRWNDHPEGVDEPEETEWYSYREITHTRINGEDVVTYGNFCEPMIWSQFGKTGRDGDGVQYIFARTQNRPFGSQLVKPATWINDSGYQDKYGEYIPENTGWYDDPEQAEPNENYPFEWVSMRKWRVNSSGVGSWSAYTEPSLWACYVEDSENRTIVTLDLGNSSQPVPVDTSNKVLIDSTFVDNKLGGECVLTTDDGRLLDWDKVYLGTLSGGNITWASSPSITISNYVASVNNSVTVTPATGITCSISDGYANDHRCYGFVLKAEFTSNTTLSEAAVIPVKVESDSFVGIDYIYLKPVRAEKIVTLSVLGALAGIKKESENATTYSPDTVKFYGWVNDKTYDTVSNIRYSYAIDNGTPVEIAPIGSTNKQTIVNSRATGTHFYYDVNGNAATASNYFADLWIYNSDDNQHEWDDWSAIMSLKLDGLNIKDKVTLGVGYKDVITDDEPVHVIWPGKDGNGISRIEKAYRYDSDSTRTTAYLESVNDWLPTRNDAGHGGEYVYTRITTVYTSNPTTVEYIVEYVPKDGTDGASGTAVPYVYRGEWEANTEYYNTSSRIDIVKYSYSPTPYYICLKTHTSTATEFDDIFDETISNEFWKPFDGEYQNIATGFIFAESGYFQTLKAAEIETSSTYPKITINAGGSTGTNGTGDNAIKAYDISGNNGIYISGNNLPDAFEVTSSDVTSSGTLEYYTKEQGTWYPVLDSRSINGSGDAYTTAITNINTTSQSTILIKNAPSLIWQIYDGSNTMNVSNISNMNNAMSLPNLELVVIDGSKNKVGSLGIYEWNGSLNNYNSFKNYGGIVLSENTSYKAILVPQNSDVFVGPIGGDSSVTCNGNQISWNDVELTITGSDTLTYDIGDGAADRVGITIAPNGILVFFNSRNYFQFANVNDSILAKLIVNGVNKI